MAQPTTAHETSRYLIYVVCNSLAVLEELKQNQTLLYAVRASACPVIFLAADQIDQIDQNDCNRVFPCLIDVCQKKNFSTLSRCCGPLTLLSPIVCPTVHILNVGENQQANVIAEKITETIAPAIKRLWA
ncbi:MAG: hypothetical protein WCK11_03385 [Candidatus Falkowbacteria bacterium]